MKSGFAVAIIMSLLACKVAGAADIKVLASGATKEIVGDLVPEFEKKSGHNVTVEFAGTATIKKRLTAGDFYDLVIVGAPVVDAFIQQNKLAAGSRVDLMKSGVGVAGRVDAAKPDIGSSSALKKTLLAAKSIGYSSGPSGDYVMTLVARLGIAEQVKAKMKQVAPGARIGTMLESGEVEIGFQQVSELIHEKNIVYLGPLPADVQKITVFAAGIHVGAKQPEAAKTFVKALKSPEATTAIKAHGMEPG
jgi:molybdate transport system substrate-binding protein